MINLEIIYNSSWHISRHYTKCWHKTYLWHCFPMRVPHRISLPRISNLPPASPLYLFRSRWKSVGGGQQRKNQTQTLRSPHSANISQDRNTGSRLPTTKRSEWTFNCRSKRNVGTIWLHLKPHAVRQASHPLSMNALMQTWNCSWLWDKNVLWVRGFKIYSFWTSHQSRGKARARSSRQNCLLLKGIWPNSSIVLTASTDSFNRCCLHGHLGWTGVSSSTGMSK